MKKLNTYQDYLDAKAAFEKDKGERERIQNHQAKRRAALNTELKRLDDAIKPILVREHLSEDNYNLIRSLILKPWENTGDPASKTRYLFGTNDNQWFNSRAWLRPMGSGYTPRSGHVWHWTLRHHTGEIRIAEHGLRDPASIEEVTKTADDFLRSQGWILT